MIDQIYQTLQTILNKEHAGYVSPTEFNLLAKQVQDKIFRSYFEDENRDRNRENKGLTNHGYSNLSFNQRQRINQFSGTSTIAINGSNYDLPANLYFIEQGGVVSATGKVIEEVERNSMGYLSGSLSTPSATYPVYERYSNYITVNPSTITTDITMKYITTPIDPKWTYTVVSNKELYNPAAGDHQDFELHESEFSNIVLQMLTYFGINLREGEVIQIAEQLKNVLNVKDNT